MAVKIARQTSKIAILGAPTSAAALSAGHENAPSALRQAGLIARLTDVGYQVSDLGDDPPQVYKPDDESPRARNLAGVIKSLEALKPRVEQAVKSGALPLILGGDCSIALATVAGARRYFRHVSVIYMDRDADLNTPSTTPSGCVDGMVVAHLTGRGAAELVRFWGEPPLVREPDLALFGVDRLDPSEEEFLRRSTLRKFMADDIKVMGAAAAARAALDRIHANGYEFILHFDVDAIADFPATNYPASGGLTLEEAREALDLFMQQKTLAAVEVTAYNPAKDPDGAWAKRVIDLLAHGFGNRLSVLQAVAQAAPESPKEEASALGVEAPSAQPDTETKAEAPSAPGEESKTAPVAPEEAGSSDSLEQGATKDESSSSADDEHAAAQQGSTGESAQDEHKGEETHAPAEDSGKSSA